MYALTSAHTPLLCQGCGSDHVGQSPRTGGVHQQATGGCREAHLREQAAEEVSWNTD